MGQLCQGTPLNTGFVENSTDITILVPVEDLRSTTQLRQSTGSGLRNSNSHLNGSALILGCKTDQNLAYLNKYMLLFIYFIQKTNSNVQKEINDFVTILKEINQQQTHVRIQNFEKQYQLQINAIQRQNFILRQFFKNEYFSSAIEKFPTVSQDPRIFGYIQRPFIDLYKGIKSKYVDQKKIKSMYCVVQMKKKEFDVLSKIAEEKIQNYFTFSTFMRCYSDEDKAKQRQKQLLILGQDLTQSQNIQSQTVFFYIQFPKQKNDRNYDHGFYLAQDQKENEFGDIVINIRNYFKIVDSDIKQKTFTLNYNAFGRLIHMTRERQLQVIPKILPINDVITGKSTQINSQSSLIRAIGQRSISLSTSQKALQNTSINEKIQNTEKINLIKSYIEQKNYQLALKCCQQAIKSSNQNKIRFQVQQARIYYEMKKYQITDQIIKDIQLKKQDLKKHWFDDYYLYEFMAIKRIAAKGTKKRAKQRLAVLKQQMIKKYVGIYQFKGRQIEQFLLQLEPKKSGKSSQLVNWDEYCVGINIGMTLSH